MALFIIFGNAVATCGRYT